MLKNGKPISTKYSAQLGHCQCFKNRQMFLVIFSFAGPIKTCLHGLFKTEEYWGYSCLPGYVYQTTLVKSIWNRCGLEVMNNSSGGIDLKTLLKKTYMNLTQSLSFWSVIEIVRRPEATHSMKRVNTHADKGDIFQLILKSLA